MDILTKKRADRFQFLNKLYEVTGGNKMRFPNMYELGDQIGISREETNNVTDYLQGEGLIEHKTIGGGIAITHYGVVEVENALSKPTIETQYFPAVVNILNVQNMTNSQIQQGTEASTQSYAASSNDLSVIKEIISLLKNEINDLPIDSNQKSEISAEVATVEAQLNSSNPKKVILKESLKTIRSIFEGIVSEVISSKYLQLFSNISSYLA